MLAGYAKNTTQILFLLCLWMFSFTQVMVVIKAKDSQNWRGPFMLFSDWPVQCRCWFTHHLHWEMKCLPVNNLCLYHYASPWGAPSPSQNKKKGPYKSRCVQDRENNNSATDRIMDYLQAFVQLISLTDHCTIFFWIFLAFSIHTLRINLVTSTDPPCCHGLLVLLINFTSCPLLWFCTTVAGRPLPWECASFYCLLCV